MRIPWVVRSVLAGAAGTTAMTLAYEAERRVRGARTALDYDDSLVPGEIVAGVLHLGNVTPREDLAANAARVGRRILAGAIELAAEHEIVGDARGLGLYLGIELVRDRDTLEPAAAEASYVIERCKQLGVLVSIDGPFHNVLKIKPPIVWGDAEADRLLGTLDRVLREQPLRP